MTTKRDSEMTGEKIRELASPRRATTYDQAENGYRCTIDARERFEELTNRDLMARAHATLKARGTYDPQQHGDVGQHQPLTADERLELRAGRRNPGPLLPPPRARAPRGSGWRVLVPNRCGN